MFINWPKRMLYKYYRVLDNRFLYNASKRRLIEQTLYDYFCKSGVPKAMQFNISKVREATLSFVNSMKVGAGIPEYKFSTSTKYPNIYSSAYACMTRSLYKDLESLTEKERQEWVNYFNSFQSKEDGLFRDPNIMSEIFEKEDWWGARHLAAHLIIAYTVLGSKPKHDFYFLEPFYNSDNVVEWLETRDWKSKADFVGNEVMNYGVLLQYSRDYFQNKSAGYGVKTMMKWLEEHFYKNTGLWGEGPFDTPHMLSKAVQGVYHIYPLFFYDNWDTPYNESLIDQVLKTQNKLGGCGVALNSSACEDMDSIFLIIFLAQRTNYRENEILGFLKRAFPWILANMNEDGGFVFRRNEGLVYGHPEMSSQPNESNMFATWFRTLNVAYLVNFLYDSSIYEIVNAPGYSLKINGMN